MPMQSAVWQGFSEVNEAVDPAQLKPNQLAALTNGVIDATGEVFSISKRGAFSQYNSNTLVSLLAWKALFDVVDANSNNYLLGIASDGSANKSSLGTGTWSAIVGLSFAAGYMVRLAAYAGKNFLTDGYGVPQMTDLTNAYNILPTPPDTSGVTISTTGTGLTGGYLYAIVYVMDDGAYSIPGQPLYINLTNEGASLTSVPYSTDSRVTQVYIFRTQANGTNFYYNGAQPNNTAGGTFTYTDYASDSTLDLATVLYTNLAPTKAYFPLIHKDRLIFGYVTLNNIPWQVYPIGGGPTLTPSAVTGSMTLLGTYHYKICYVEAGTGVLTALSQAFTQTLTGSDQSMTISGIVLPVAPNVSAQIYRTKAGGSTYYYLATVTGSGTSLLTTTFTDTIADSALTQQYVASASTKTYSWTLDISEPGQPELMLNTFDIFPDDGNPIVALADDGDGILVWKKNSLSKLYSIGAPENWQLISVDSSIGADSQETVVKVPGGFVFLFGGQAYLYETGTRSVNEVPISETRRPSFAAVTSFTRGCYNAVNDWIAFGGTDGTNGILLLFDLKVKTWYRFVLPVTTVYWIMTRRIGADSGKFILAGDADGTLAYYTTGASADNVAPSTNQQISVTITTGVLQRGDSISLMRPRILQVNRNKLNGQNIVHTLTNIDAANSVTSTESSGSGIGVTRIVTDGMTGTKIETAKRLQYSASGAGIVQWQSVKLEYRPVNRGTVNG